MAGIDYGAIRELVGTVISEIAGFTVNLMHLPGSVVDIGVMATPFVEEEVIEEGRVVDRVMATVIAANDPELSSPPKAGDMVILGARKWRVLPGRQRGVVTDAGDLVHRLWLKSA